MTTLKVEAEFTFRELAGKPRCNLHWVWLDRQSGKLNKRIQNVGGATAKEALDRINFALPYIEEENG